MKHFAKILALVLALSLCLCFVGCGEEKPADTNADNKLIMATNAAFPPYEFKEADGYAGIDVEIAGLIAEKLGKELVIEDVDFGAIIGGVQTGKYDMGMAGMTVTDERKQSVNFSNTYATGVQVVIVKEDSEITVDALFAEGASHKIGVQQGTTGDLYSTWDLEDAGLATIERFKTGTDAVLALTAGKVDCVVIDNEPAKNFVAANEGLKILDTEYITEEYAIALAKGSELTSAIDAALAELIADGTLQSIVDKYITAE